MRAHIYLLAALVLQVIVGCCPRAAAAAAADVVACGLSSVISHTTGPEADTHQHRHLIS